MTVAIVRENFQSARLISWTYFSLLAAERMILTHELGLDLRHEETRFELDSPWNEIM